MDRYSDHLPSERNGFASMQAKSGPALWIPPLASDLAVNYSAGILSAPLVSSVNRLRELMQDLKAIDRHISELFNDVIGDRSFRRSELGLNEYQSQVVQECLSIEHDLGSRERFDQEPIMRADLLCNEAGAALIEMNYTSACGGFDSELVFDALRSRGAIPAHLDESRTHGNILDGLIASLCALVGPEPGMVALVDSAESYASYEPRLEILRRLLEKRGISALHTSIDAVKAGRGGALTHLPSGRRIDTVWRFFMLDEIETRHDADSIRGILDAWASGHCALFGSLVEEAKSSKALLALLSNDNRLSLRNPDLLPHAFTIGGCSRPLDGIARAHAISAWDEAFASPTDWVLKRPFGHGGHGVLVGDQIPTCDWRELLESTASGTTLAVVQRRVREAPLSIPDGGQDPVAARLNLGLFLGARDAHPEIEHYGGCFARLSFDKKSRIGLSLGSATGIMLIDNTAQKE